MPSPQLCIALVGPTASGKTELAIELSEKLPVEIVCVDSATVYRGFNIGTGKPTEEQQAKVPHHLLDILDPKEPFSAFHFVQRAEETLSEIWSRKKIPLVVGGSYFYLKALQHGMYSLPVIPNEMVESIEAEFTEDEKVDTLKMHKELSSADPESGKQIHVNDRYRLLRALAIYRTTNTPPSQLKPVRVPGAPERIWLKYAMTLSRSQLHQNILKRVEGMLQQGLVEETRKLAAAHPGARALSSIGYAEACSLLNRKLTEKQLGVEIVEKTRQLAKRQITWLRSDPHMRFVDSRDVGRITLDVENLTVAMGWKAGAA